MHFVVWKPHKVRIQHVEITTITVLVPLQMALQHGDMIVIGSDGLWDNVFDDEILSILASPQVGIV